MKLMNEQQQNHRLRTDISLSYRGGGFNAFQWYQFFAVDWIVSKTEKKCSKLEWRLPNYCNVAMNTKYTREP